MLPSLPRASHCLRLCAIGLAVASAAAQSPPPPVTGGPPISAGEARVWFYRVFFPEDTGGMPAIAMNGDKVGYARAGWSFYRDVPAGAYHVTVDSFIQDVSQAKDIVVQAGTQVALAIQSDPTWISNLSGFRRGTYYVTAETGDMAYMHIMQTQFGDGY